MQHFAVHTKTRYIFIMTDVRLVTHHKEVTMIDYIIFYGTWFILGGSLVGLLWVNIQLARLEYKEYRQRKAKKFVKDYFDSLPK